MKQESVPLLLEWFNTCTHYFHSECGIGQGNLTQTGGILKTSPIANILKTLIVIYYFMDAI